MYYLIHFMSLDFPMKSYLGQFSEEERQREEILYYNRENLIKEGGWNDFVSFFFIHKQSIVSHPPLIVSLILTNSVLQLNLSCCSVSTYSAIGGKDEHEKELFPFGNVICKWDLHIPFFFYWYCFDKYTF